MCIRDRVKEAASKNGEQGEQKLQSHVSASIALSIHLAEINDSLLAYPFCLQLCLFGAFIRRHLK